MKTILVIIDHENIPDDVLVEIPDGMTDDEARDYASEQGLEEARFYFGARCADPEDGDNYDVVSTDGKQLKELREEFLEVLPGVSDYDLDEMFGQGHAYAPAAVIRYDFEQSLDCYDYTIEDIKRDIFEMRGRSGQESA